MTPRVVFSPTTPLLRNVRASVEKEEGQPRPPNSFPCSNGAAQKCGPLPMVMLPAALAAASAPTVSPPRVCALAEPIPPLKLTVVARRARCVVAEFTIGRVAVPLLVSAGQQVKQNCGRHDRHPRLANLKSSPL